MKNVAGLSEFLTNRGVPHALVGAAALAFHGVSRSTRDVDFLVTDLRVLVADFWASLDRAIGRVECRKGSFDDPLAGVVRIRGEASSVIDVVVGKFGWQSRILERSEKARFGGASVAVVSTADLVLLKLFAGGAQDRWDIDQLLGVSEDPGLVARVDDLVGDLPGDARMLWRELRERQGRDSPGR